MSILCFLEIKRLTLSSSLTACVAVAMCESSPQRFSSESAMSHRGLAGVNAQFHASRPRCVVLPLFIESVKDGIEDSLHALQVGEQDHGPGAPADFEEAGSAPGVDWVVTGPTPLGFVSG